MFDFIEMMTVGTELEAHGKTWIQIKHIKEGWYLAAEKDAKAPAPVMMIFVEKKEETKEPEGV